MEPAPSVDAEPPAPLLTGRLAAAVLCWSLPTALAFAVAPLLLLALDAVNGEPALLLLLGGVELGAVAGAAFPLSVALRDRLSEGGRLAVLLGLPVAGSPLIGLQTVYLSGLLTGGPELGLRQLARALDPPALQWVLAVSLAAGVAVSGAVGLVHLALLRRRWREEEGRPGGSALRYAATALALSLPVSAVCSCLGSLGWAVLGSKSQQHLSWGAVVPLALGLGGSALPAASLALAPVLPTALRVAERLERRFAAPPSERREAAP